jgi:hypothetical protein
MIYPKILSKLEPKDMKKAIDSSSYQIVIVVFGLFETQTAHWEYYLTSCIDKNGTVHITDDIGKLPTQGGRTYTTATTNSISIYGRKLKTLDEGVKWAEEFKMKWESGSNDILSEVRDKKLDEILK